MDQIFYTPETFGLNIPFIGEINVVFWLCVAAGVALFWNQLPLLLGWLIKTVAPKLGDGIVALVKKLFGFAKGGVDAAGKAVANASAAKTEASASPIKSVHELTEWAFETKDPETLEKVTSLYSVLQKQAINATVAALMIILMLSGCADPGAGRCGWHPKEPSNAAIQQIEDERDSLRNQAPDQFE